MDIEKILRYFSGTISKCIGNVKIDNISEIRVRVGQPLIINTGREMFLIGTNGIVNSVGESYCATTNDFREIMERICSHSRYAYEENMKNGYITVEGGHRVGFGGCVITDSQGGGNEIAKKIVGIKNIAFINFRIAREISGCAKAIEKYVCNAEHIYNVLIVSPPGLGKTTVLRDITRCISNDLERFPNMSICVIDERSEIAGCYMGIPSMDVGMRTDVLDGCPKSQGMMMALRTMSPKVMIVDELGGKGDCEAVSYAAQSGCSIIASAHGENIDELMCKPYLGKLISDKIFEKTIVIKGLGKYQCI